MTTIIPKISKKEFLKKILLSGAVAFGGVNTTPELSAEEPIRTASTRVISSLPNSSSLDFSRLNINKDAIETRDVIPLVLQMMNTIEDQFSNFKFPQDQQDRIKYAHNVATSIPPSTSKTKIENIVIYFERLHEAAKSKKISNQDLSKIFNSPNQLAISLTLSRLGQRELTPQEISEKWRKVFDFAQVRDQASDETFKFVNTILPKINN
jgi:hypothetical protein